MLATATAGSTDNNQLKAAAKETATATMAAVSAGAVTATGVPSLSPSPSACRRPDGGVCAVQPLHPRRSVRDGSRRSGRCSRVRRRRRRRRRTCDRGRRRGSTTTRVVVFVDRGQATRADRPHSPPPCREDEPTPRRRHRDARARSVGGVERRPRGCPRHGVHARPVHAPNGKAGLQLAAQLVAHCR